MQPTPYPGWRPATAQRAGFSRARPPRRSPAAHGRAKRLPCRPRPVLERGGGAGGGGVLPAPTPPPPRGPPRRARAGETTALSPAPCARTGWRVGWGWPAPRHSLTLVRAVGEQAKRTLAYHHLSAVAQVGRRSATTRYARFICQRPCPAAAGGSSSRPLRSGVG